MAKISAAQNGISTIGLAILATLRQVLLTLRICRIAIAPALSLSQRRSFSRGINLQTQLHEESIQVWGRKETASTYLWRIHSLDYIKVIAPSWGPLKESNYLPNSSEKYNANRAPVKFVNYKSNFHQTLASINSKRRAVASTKPEIQMPSLRTAIATEVLLGSIKINFLIQALITITMPWSPTHLQLDCLMFSKRYRRKFHSPTKTKVILWQAAISMEEIFTSQFLWANWEHKIHFIQIELWTQEKVKQAAIIILTGASIETKVTNSHVSQNPLPIQMLTYKAIKALASLIRSTLPNLACRLSPWLYRMIRIDLQPCNQ